MRLFLTCFFLLATGFLTAPESRLFGQDAPVLNWELRHSNADVKSLRGLWVVNEEIVWASGTGGTVLRTIDGGESWQDVSIPDAPENDFRDIMAFNTETAVVVTAGQPAAFYRTEDGGVNWEKVFQHGNEAAFFDAIAAIDSNHLIAMGDPIDDRILLVESLDQGKTWNELPAERRPEKEAGEAGFAASGSNMIVDKQTGTIFLALGSAAEGEQHETSRVVYSSNRAQTWLAHNFTMKRTQSSGIFSIARLASGRIVAVGGDYENPDETDSNCAIGLFDGSGECRVPETGPGGYRSGVCDTQMADDRVLLITVGTNGSDFSLDDGNTWAQFSDRGFHAVKSTGEGSIWACGADGKIAKLILEK